MEHQESNLAAANLPLLLSLLPTTRKEVEETNSFILTPGGTRKCPPLSLNSGVELSPFPLDKNKETSRINTVFFDFWQQTGSDRAMINGQ